MESESPNEVRRGSQEVGATATPKKVVSRHTENLREIEKKQMRAEEKVAGNTWVSSTDWAWQPLELSSHHVPAQMHRGFEVLKRNR